MEENLKNKRSINFGSVLGGAIIGLIIVLSIVMRVIVIDETEIDTPIRADAYDYYHYAINLKLFNVYSKQVYAGEGRFTPEPDAVRSPGFPLFASLMIDDKGGDWIKKTLNTQTVIQIFAFLALTFMFIHKLGTLLAILPSLILWTFPHFLTVNTYFLTESIFLSLLVLAVCGAYWASRVSGDHRIALVGLVGFIIGCSSLVRPVTEYFPLFFFLVTAVFYKKHLKVAGAMLIGAIIPILYWKMRNVFAIDSVSDSSLIVNALYHGSFPGFVFYGVPESYGFPYRFDPRAAEAALGVSSALNIMWERAIADPVRHLYWYLLEKQLFLWQWNIIAGQGGPFIYPVKQTPYHTRELLAVSLSLNYWMHIFWVVMGCASAIYLGVSNWLVRHKPSFSGFEASLFVVFCYITLFHMVTAPFPRYGIPFKILLLVSLVCAVKRLVSKRAES